MDMNLTEAVHIFTNNTVAERDSSFRQASKVLWNHVHNTSIKMAPQYADEMTSVLLTRLFQRRSRPFQVIDMPVAYIYAALRNIHLDILRKVKRQSGYMDVTGEFQYHRSLDEMVSDGAQSLHEKIASSIVDIEEEDPNELALLALRNMIRAHIYTMVIKEVPNRTPKGAKTFMTAAKNFQAFADNTFQPENDTAYKKFDRQRQHMLDYLEKKVGFVPQRVTQRIYDFIELHHIQAKRNAQLDLAEKDKTLNPEIVSRRIDAEVVTRVLFDYVLSLDLSTQIQMKDILSDSIASGLLSHCQLQLFRLDIFRTKKKKGTISSIYFTECLSSL